MDTTAHHTATTAPSAGEQLTVRRLFTTAGIDPFDSVEWEVRDARIGQGDNVVFEQHDIEFPASWSQNATNIVAQKYFRGQLSSPERERSVRQMIGRVSGTIADWGRARGYFAGNPPSSPAIAILRDGQLIYLMQRSAIESSSAPAIAQELTRAFDVHCATAAA